MDDSGGFGSFLFGVVSTLIVIFIALKLFDTQAIVTPAVYKCTETQFKGEYPDRKEKCIAFRLKTRKENQVE